MERRRKTFSGLCTKRFCSDCSLKTSQALTCHWDFCSPPSCRDSASAQREQGCLPLPAAASSLEDLPPATVKVPNSPDPPALVSAFLLLPHPHITSAPRGVSTISPIPLNPRIKWVRSPTNRTLLGYFQNTES